MQSREIVSPFENLRGTAPVVPRAQNAAGRIARSRFQKVPLGRSGLDDPGVIKRSVIAFPDTDDHTTAVGDTAEDIIPEDTIEEVTGEAEATAEDTAAGAVTGAVTGVDAIQRLLTDEWYLITDSTSPWPSIILMSEFSKTREARLRLR